jgi:murein L,D-transpeptidase YafK
MNLSRFMNSDSYPAFAEFVSRLYQIPVEALIPSRSRWSLSGLQRLFRVSLLSGCLVLPLTAHGAAAKNELWLRVDTQDATLTVMKGDRAKIVFRNVAIGRYGKTYFKRKGDEKTPLGRFTIAWIPRKSRYHRFLGLDYPDLERADRALVAGEITEAQWQAIRRATKAGKRPPQDTPLGGFVGIHGTGDGDPRVHVQFNWTSGCIALTNDQIDRLARWVRVGTPVEIR